MRRMGSLILASADRNRVPAGGALAVDREAFSRTITETLLAMPHVHLQRRECTAVPEERPFWRPVR